MDFFYLLICICAFPLLILLISKWRYSYWKRRGVLQLDPEFLFGDLRDMLTSKVSNGDAFKKIYFTFKNKKVDYGGIYLSFNPVFIPLNLELIKDILVKNFNHFQDRENYIQNFFEVKLLLGRCELDFIKRKSVTEVETNDIMGFGMRENEANTTSVVFFVAPSIKSGYSNEKDILTQQLFRLEGDHWKQLRGKLTPTFTSNRMKMMFETINEKTNQFPNIIDQYIKNGGQINLSDLSARFTTDVIGSCGFGIECDSLANPDCDFRIYGKDINTPNMFREWMENAFPRKLLVYTGFRMFPDIEDFYINLVLKTIEHREKNQVFRKDFMHLLLQLRNRGELSDDGKPSKEKNKTGILTTEEIIAQCFLFFSAGYESSSVTMTMALYEVAKNQLIQDKMREEIRQVLKKYDDKLTYEGAKEMVYIEKVILETLRKYPVLPAIPRICTKKYRIPGTNVYLEKGTKVQIPAWGIHMDPEFYPNPEIFDPERFSTEQKSKRPDFTYMPFSEGPRNCIGARFGMLQAKIGIVGLLKDHRYSFSERTPIDLSFKPGIISLHPTKEIFFNVEKV